MRVLGLMSGTSADGVEAVLAEFSGNPKQPKWSLINFSSLPYPKILRERIIAAGQKSRFSSKEWLDLVEAITEVHFEAARACDPKGLSELVGCHGQTIWHRPPCEGQRGASLQLLQAPLLAQLMKCPVVHDFRAADLALGGHGAPLVPTLDSALFGRVTGWRAILNLGGIANLTLIPPNTGPDRFASVLGWDCGPGNTLIDFAVQKITNGKLSFDQDGLIAARGSPNEEILDCWLKEPFFQKAPPKSTGREQFGRLDLENRLSQIKSISDEDLISTLTAFSAAVVAKELDNLHSRNLIRPIELLVAGGGCRNPALLDQIIRRCRGLRVASIEQNGIAVQSREALAFALLAWWHILKHPGNSTAITGASRSGVLGMIVNPV